MAKIPKFRLYGEDDPRIAETIQPRLALRKWDDLGKEKEIALQELANRGWLRNGVDLDLFRPVDRATARRRLGLDHQTLLSVGHLIPRKGYDLVIRALPALSEKYLLIVGDGPERRNLEQLASKLKVQDRVQFLGQISHERLREVYTAADALVLASSREGWANVP